MAEVFPRQVPHLPQCSYGLDVTQLTTSLDLQSSFISSSRNCLLDSSICKGTTVTHTKRIDRNLLRKESSFVCCTSSVLRKSPHIKQKEKITHCC